MIEKLVARKKREVEAMSPKDDTMPDTALFHQMGKHVKVVKQ